MFFPSKFSFHYLPLLIYLNFLRRGHQYFYLYQYFYLMQKSFNFKPLFNLLVFRDNYYMVGSFQDEHTYFLLKEFQHSTLRINFIYLGNHCIFEISLDEYILILYISCSPWQILNFEFLNILRQILNF